MASVVRIKRRLEDEPLDTLVLNCKRQKINGDGNTKSEKLSAVLQFARTCHQEENLETVLIKHIVPDFKQLKQQFKKHPVNLNDKARKELKEKSKNNRYKIVNRFRAYGDEVYKHNTIGSEVSSDSTPQYTVFDLETDINESDPSIKNKSQICDEPSYVYDLYYTCSDDFGEADIEDYVSVSPLNDPLVFGSIKGSGLHDETGDEDSDDSNAENNWRNDYPDESDLESVNEEDMIQAVKNLNIDEDLLSSDEGEEAFVYSIDDNDSNDIDENDVENYGHRYARFKAKFKNIETEGLHHDLYYGDIDEDEYYF